VTSISVITDTASVIAQALEKKVLSVPRSLQISGTRLRRAVFGSSVLLAARSQTPDKTVCHCLFIKKKNIVQP
jgi:hypothetical protein